MSWWHTATSGWGWNKKEDHVEAQLEKEAEDKQREWKRDFEEDNQGVIGRLRQRIRDGMKNERLAAHGMDIQVHNLNYISPPLHREFETLPGYLMHVTNVVGRVRNMVAPDPSKCKTILKNINLELKDGSMTLVIGSPGSGKSSLCRILANQDVNGRVEGELLCGGKKIHKSDHSHRVAYVRDVDTHYAHLTVKETFEFAYSLLTPSPTSEERDERVRLVMEILGLSHRADTIVGDNLTRGVSGGERRRVTVGVELLKRCQLLVMDEATTGLDSTTSLQIFRSLRIIADEMAPVFVTLKQPGRELYNLFDNVIVMHEGQIAYFGPTTEMMDYFEAAGYSVHREINPADEALSVVDEHGDELIEMWQKKSAEDGQEPPCVDEAHSQLPYSQYSRSWPVQYAWGVKRGFQLIKNDPMVPLSRVALSMIKSLIIGTMFLQLGHAQADIIGIQGALFLISTFPAFQALAGLPTVFSTRPVFYYQRKNNYFHPFPMMMADFTASAPVAIIESFAFATVAYWLCGLNTQFSRYVYLTLMVVSLEILFTIFVKICGFLLPSFLLANIIIPQFLYVLNFFTGFTVREDRAPVWMQWIFYIVPFRYLLEGITISNFVGQEFHCEHDEYLPPSSDRRFELPYAVGGYEGHRMCPYTTGEEILDSIGYHDSWAWAWYWFAVMQGFIVLALVGMVIASFWVFKKDAPRDLSHIQEQHELQNLRAHHIKESIRHALPLSRSVSRHPSSADLTSSMEVSESESEGSHHSIMDLFEAHEGGRRIQTNVPIILEWKEVCYTVRVAPPKGIKSKLGNLPLISKFVQRDLRLLNKVSGYVKPGMLIAFMGPSGAGKTTLLDVLAQRKTAGRLDGHIYVNGAPLDPETLSRFSGYVEQQNIHVETETVEEALLLSASLRLSYPDQLIELNGTSTISRAEKLDHILWVMNVLSLTPIRDAMISELSLEQKKRVTIGVELAANPSMLWLDEPTSGLDSMAALCVMRAVKRIADSGVAVVCTLHQPSELLFSWCTHLLLLGPGGNVTFFGESADANHEAKKHFSQFGMEPPADQSDADFFLDCCSSKVTNENGQTVIEAYHDSEVHQKLEEDLEKGIAPRMIADQEPWYRRALHPFAKTKYHPNPADENSDLGYHLPPQPPTYATEYARKPPVQWVYLVTRNARLWWRSPMPLVIMFSSSVIFGVVLGLLFLNLDQSQLGAVEHVSLFFFLASVITTNVMTFIPQLFDERPTFYRETASKSYSPWVYLLAIITVTATLVLINSLLVIIPLWAIARLGMTWHQIGYLWGAGVCLSLVSYGFALFLSCISPMPELANNIFTIVNILNTMTSGFLLLRTEIPPWWIWAYWAGYQHYGLEGMILNEVGDMHFHCHNNEGAFKVPVPSAEDPDRIQYYCRFRTGEDVEDFYALHHNQILVDIIVLVAFIFALFALAVLAISKVKHIKR